MTLQHATKKVFDHFHPLLVSEMDPTRMVIIFVVKGCCGSLTAAVIPFSPTSVYLVCPWPFTNRIVTTVLRFLLLTIVQQTPNFIDP